LSPRHPHYDMKDFASKASFIKLLVLTHLLFLSRIACAQNAELNVEPAQFMIMIEKVKNTEQFEKYFSETAGKINKYGVVPIGFARDANDPNMVIVGNAVLDLNQARSYIQSEQIKEDMQKSGAETNPETRFIYCLDETDDNTGNNKIMILTHTVKNYDVWRKKFFASERERIQSGLRYIAIVHTIDHPEEISLVFSCSDFKTAKEFVESKYLKNAMADAGISSEPKAQYVILNFDSPPSEKASDPGSFTNKLTLKITSNIPCSYTMNNVDQGNLNLAIIKSVPLAIGKYSFLFKSINNPADSLRVNYTVDKINIEDALYVDLQTVIHKRVIKEHSPKESSDFKNPFDMVLVKGGSFTMGSDSLTDEMKQHNVSVKDFYISRYELTQKQWKDVMGTRPSHFQNCDNCPVENVSYDDALIFIHLIDSMTGLKYRLPTEAEWEYAAKGGQESKHYTFSGSNNPEEVAWCFSNSSRETHPVGQKKPNELGLYDMTGNVFEWCSDWFGYTYYKDGISNNPSGPDHGLWKVLRGGSWSHADKECLPTYRVKDEPSNRGRRTGFRLARD